jgi:ABC-type lipoprotein export system ATPase subunit
MRERIQKLKLSQISKSFDGKTQLFDDINFEFEFGKIVFLEGSLGAGKSLLLRMIAGLIEPTSGEIIYNKKSISSLSFEELVPLRLSTAFCFEDGGLLMNKTCLENLKLPLLYHRQWRNGRSDLLLKDLAKLFDVEKFLDLRPAQVSNGIRKTIGLMRTLLHNPQILFLDEPSLGVGDDGVKALKVSLEKFRREGVGDELILIASNDKRFMQEFEAQHIKIKDRKLVAA